MKWLVGCIPMPAGGGKGARQAAVRALTASANSWQMAVANYGDVKEQFLKDEKDRTRAYRFIDRLRWLAALRGPGAEPAPSREQRVAIVSALGDGRMATGGLGQHHTWRQVLATIEGRQARKLGCAEDRLCSAAEWGAAVVLVYSIRKWRRERGHREARDEGGARTGFKRVILTEDLWYVLL